MGYKKPSYRKQVERLLREYPRLKIRIKLAREYPSCVPNYGVERVAGGRIGSITEGYAIDWADNEIEVKRIETALGVLNLDERLLIEQRYFDPVVFSDSVIYDRLGWSKRTYYRIKQAALEKLAFVLDMK
jgi:ArpU family phage transcriptional regulator